MIVHQRPPRVRVPQQRRTEPDPSVRVRSGLRGTAGPPAPRAVRRALARRRDRLQSVAGFVVMWLSIVVFCVLAAASFAAWWDVA